MRDLVLRERIAILARLLTRGRLLKRTPFWSPDQMRDWQFERIRALVRHACERVPFYADLYRSAGFQPEDLKTWDDFERLPCVSKEQVIANYPARMIASGFDLEDLIVSRSSGSSGKVLDIAYDADAMITYVLAGLRLYRMCFRYRPWHKQVYIYTSPYPMGSLLGMYPLHFIHTLAPVTEILEAINRLKPDLLVCYPSHLRQILQAARSEDLAGIHPKAVSVNSEMSTQAERDALADQLGCPVLDEYSSEELTRIAAQCRHKTYHIFEDINHIEILDEEGRTTAGSGTIVGTNLHNFAMPMIRYRQNDIGRIERGTCPCGWKFQRLVGFEGRRNDSFVLPSGKVLSSGFLLDATYEFLLNDRAAVLDFCLIQRRRDAIALQIVPGSEWSAGVEKNIRSRFGGFLEAGVSFDIEVVQECDKTKTGKRNPIINQSNRA